MKIAHCAPAWRRGEWIWVTRPSGLHKKFTTVVKYQFHQGFYQIRDPEIPITLSPNNNNNNNNLLLCSHGVHMNHNRMDSKDIRYRKEHGSIDSPVVIITIIQSLMTLETGLYYLL